MKILMTMKKKKTITTRKRKNGRDTAQKPSLPEEDYAQPSNKDNVTTVMDVGGRIKNLKSEPLTHPTADRASTTPKENAKEVSNAGSYTKERRRKRGKVKEREKERIRRNPEV